MTEQGRPPTTVLVCHEVVEILLENGIPANAKIPRPLFDELLAKGRRVSWAQTENILRTGQQHGLWNRIRGAGRIQGWVQLTPTAQT